ncbi:MAG: 3'(2'),5'-bisphosphate nucleotidase CysQ [Xanthomonadales bacterium]|nr:3'(2'),5'-bisphosphate nucleotidase CysQ [Xanthomonadales bacterium]
MSSVASRAQLVALARRAGQAILDVYAREFEVELKDDRSPLTEADLASHRIICDGLRALEPGTPVLSEESAEIPFEQRSCWNRYYLVDPLDGTKEFVGRNGEFTVNIALIEDHRPVLGVVHVPVSGVTYSGQLGDGAFRLDGGESRIAVRKPAADPLVVVGSRSHANPDLQARLEALGPHRLVSMGSSLKFCLVAEGEADFYPRLGPTSEWDTGAAQAVVEAAGGQVTRLDGSPLRYNTKDELLNPHFLVFGDDSRDWARLMAAAR